MQNDVMQWKRVSGIVQRGYQVASGLAQERSPYPAGTIALQIPYFRSRGLDLTDCYPGTLNVAIEPVQFTLHRPDYTFRQVNWTTAHPPEDFSFSRCWLQFHGIRYDGWVYYPHPETKAAHFQTPSLLELLAPKIADIHYGDRIEVALNAAAIALEGA